MSDAVTAEILTRLDRLETILARFIAKNEPDATLHAVLSHETSWDWFFAGEVYRMAQAEDEAATASGDARPGLITALENSGVFNAHALTRWILRQEQGFERGPTTRDGVLWRCTPVEQTTGAAAVSNPRNRAPHF